MTRAVLDACVLYSAFLRDLFMRLTVRFAFQPIWSEEIHDEWMRNVLKNRPDLERETLENTRRQMDRYGRDCLAPNYHGLLDTLTLPDANDRHVLAAAIAAHAPTIVTFNLSDFPAASLAPYGIEAQHPDVFLSALFDSDAERFVQAVRDLLAALHNPPVSLANRLERMQTLGLEETARRVEEAFNIEAFNNE